MRRDQLITILTARLGELTCFARWLARDSAEAEELVQEAVARALGHGETLREAGKARAWLFRLVRNVYIDRRRAAATRERFVVLEGGLDELAALEIVAWDAPLPWDRLDLEQALLALPEVARSAVLLSDLWGLEQAEIASVLDLPVGTVKSTVSRARARLVDALAQRERARGRARERRR
jgi:RNA polymerase sigma-70 factor (ECF subfamily)